MAPETNRPCEHTYINVPEVAMWAEMVASVLQRKQTPTAATGACGYHAIKMSLGVCDIRCVMVDIKTQVLQELAKNRNNGVDAAPEERDLSRIETALAQVDSEGIERAGWFSDFLAIYVARAYGITILIIRGSEDFSYIQVPVS